MIISNSYNEFIDENIVVLSSYKDASKRMSFSYRYKNDNGEINQDIFAYASLREFNVCKEGVGCQIMECSNKTTLADERFFNQIEMTAYMWNEDRTPKFDYLWFSVDDINEAMADRILKNIEDFEFDKINRIYIKKFNR